MTTAGPINPLSVQHGHFPMSFANPEQGNKYMKFLGPPITDLKVTPFDQQNYPTYDLPEAYKGDNLFLTQRITGFVLEDISWYTTVCLPWLETDQLHVVYNEWHFNTVLASRVPHQGTPRLVTTSKRQFKTVRNFFSSSDLMFFISTLCDEVLHSLWKEISMQQLKDKRYFISFYLQKLTSDLAISKKHHWYRSMRTGNNRSRYCTFLS